MVGDFTVVDLKRVETIRDAWIAARCGWTPYDGATRLTAAAG